jgi:hypothetical protein
LTVLDGGLKLFGSAAALTFGASFILGGSAGFVEFRASDDFVVDARNDFFDGLAFTGVDDGLGYRCLGSSSLGGWSGFWFLFIFVGSSLLWLFENRRILGWRILGRRSLGRGRRRLLSRGILRQKGQSQE